MKKKFTVVLVICIMFVLTACAKQEEKASGNRETETSAAAEESTHEVETEEEKQETENYSAAVIISINPRIKLYINSDNVVVGVEFLNKDAEEAFQGVELADLTVEQSISKIVEVTVEKKFLTDGKDISIEISDVKEEALIQVTWVKKKKRQMAEKNRTMKQRQMRQVTIRRQNLRKRYVRIAKDWVQSAVSAAGMAL